jgi:hypothetical protein
VREGKLIRIPGPTPPVRLVEIAVCPWRVLKYSSSTQAGRARTTTIRITVRDTGLTLEERTQCVLCDC